MRFCTTYRGRIAHTLGQAVRPLMSAPPRSKPADSQTERRRRDQFEPAVLERHRAAVFVQLDDGGDGGLAEARPAGPPV
jgi:hypothetical protein